MQKKNSILRTGTLMISDKSKSNYIVQIWPFAHFLHVLIFFLKMVLIIVKVKVQRKLKKKVT